MIQRIQTLYLLIIVGLMASMFFMNIAEFSCKPGEFTSIAPDGSITRMRSFEDNTISINLVAIQYSTSIEKQITWTSAILLALTVLLPLFNIFTFHNRKFQLKMCFVEGVLLIGVIAFEVLYIKAIMDYIKTTGIDSTTEYGVSIVFPLVSLILLFLAGRGIIKDEALVASYDRLR